MQEKPIVIKKHTSHRIGTAVVAILMFIVLTVCVLYLHSVVALILFIPPIIIFAPLTLYFLTWNIRFEETVIVKNVFFMERSRFSYSMLQEVKKRHYTSEPNNFTVHMYFVNGKTIRFRMNDENATKAVKILKRHCSIKTS